MKKLLYIIFAVTLFAACSSDDDKDETVYIDNSLIAGRWYWIQATDSVVLEFKDDIAKEFIYDKYTLRLKQSFENGYYKMTSEKIYYSIYPNGKGRDYKLEKDTLSFRWDGILMIDFTKIK